MPQLKKTLLLPLLGREFSVDVDFRVIEIVERAFDTSADAVIAMFRDTSRIQRNRVADVVVGWLSFQDSALKRREIREAVITADTTAFAVYLTSIYTALVYALGNIDGAAFDQVVASDKWPKVAKPAADDDDGKKKPRRASSRPATA